MNVRTTLIIVLLLIAPIVCAKTTYADAYIETGLNNREIMRWDFHCDTIANCAGAPAGQVAWTSSVARNNAGTALIFTSRHELGPHPLFDVGPGASFSFELTFAQLNALPANPVFTQVGPFTVLHPAFSTAHSDIYNVFVRRSPAGLGFDFTLASQHVPEPITLLLLCTGLGGVAIKMRKRRKSEM